MHLRDSIQQAARKLEDWRAIKTEREPDVLRIIAELRSLIPEAPSPLQTTDRTVSRLSQSCPD